MLEEGEADESRHSVSQIVTEGLAEGFDLLLGLGGLKSWNVRANLCLSSPSWVAQVFLTVKVL